jgi:hypothetical protein
MVRLRGTMNWNRVISGLLAGVYLVLAYAHGGGESAFRVGMCLILPLACIWFADAMGGFTGPTTMIAITRASPGVFVMILGWLILLLPVIIALGYALFHRDA